MKKSEFDLLKLLEIEKQAVLEKIALEHNRLIGFSPLQVGDVIDIPRDAYVHAGKKCKIKRVAFNREIYSWSENPKPRYCFNYFADVMKKNGGIGEQSVSWNVEIEVAA